MQLYHVFIIYVLYSNTPSVGYSTTPGCDYEGKLHSSGSIVETKESCLQCQCVRGTVVCRLKSCHPLLDPPPPGCALIHKTNHCCPQLHCKTYDKNEIVDRRSRLENKVNHGKSRQHGEGCMLNGTMYGEGSALVTSSRCEYCYCIKGKQQCIRPQCLLSVPGCSPIYSPHSCCPVKYNCSNTHNVTTTSSTTEVPISSSVKYSEEGCEVDSVYYPEGEKVEEFAGKCENCFCVKSAVRCEPVTCGQALDPTCTPVHSNGQCCPSRFNCSGLNDLDKENAIAGQEDVTESSTSWPLVTSTGRLQEDEATTEGYWYEDNGGTAEVEETPPTSSLAQELDPPSPTDEEPFIDTEERKGLEDGAEDGNSSTELKMEDTTPVPTAPARTLSPELEAILNRTLQRQDDSDYDYDYNESSLPPSLPNLKIIPFVAADALVDMDGQLQYFDVPKEALGRTESSGYYNSHLGPLPSRFSPPAETEGGFMPRDPVLDGPYYESKHINKDRSDIDITTSLPLQGSSHIHARCLKGGRVYQHGEVVSEMNACEICMCYFGYIHCQEPKCAPVISGCFRVKDVPGSCCGRIQCGSNLTENTIQSSREHTTTLSPLEMDMMTNIPIITVADDIVTPDILKEMAIRTEPAPDLTNIANFLTYPPFGSNFTSERPLVTNSTTTESSPAVDSYIESRHNTTQETHPLPLNKTRPKVNETVLGSNGNSYDDYDNFSFGSVLDMLFGPATSTERSKVNVDLNSTNPQTRSTYPPSNNITRNKTRVESASVDNVVVRDSDKSKDFSTRSPVFQAHDYDADIIKNTDEFLDQISVPSDNRPVSNVSATSVNLHKNSSDSDQGSNGTKLKTPMIVSKADPVAAFGLLKLDGCNIYGKMYRIGRIITELSGPCLECRCTQVGVQCEPLGC